ncbi:hypothetical protein D3C72_803550 [compost metagenome]
MQEQPEALLISMAFLSAEEEYLIQSKRIMDNMMTTLNYFGLQELVSLYEKTFIMN